MGMTEVKSCKTCIDGLLARRLEAQFPWLATHESDDVSGADTIDALVAFHRTLVERRNTHPQQAQALQQGADAWQLIIR